MLDILNGLQIEEKFMLELKMAVLLFGMQKKLFLFVWFSLFFKKHWII